MLLSAATITETFRKIDKANRPQEQVDMAALLAARQVRPALKLSATVYPSVRQFTAVRLRWKRASLSEPAPQDTSSW
jgi:hypothetical protein